MDQAAQTSPPSPAPRPLLYFAMWQRGPAKEKAQLLAGWGYDVVYDYSFSKDELNDAVGRLLALKPSAILLSLDEFPGYTRQLALGLKAKSGLRHIPRVAVGGEAAQAQQLVQALPELAHCGWEDLRGCLAGVLGSAAPPEGAAVGQVKAFL
jgi:hypothetical protein